MLMIVRDDARRVTAGDGDPCIDVAMALAAWIAGVEPGAVIRDTRGKAQVAAARHLAIYLSHVVLGRDIKHLSRAFRRDRASLRHAIRRIEDARDDMAFDQRLSRIEAILMPLRGALEARR
jgi:hypothetical protein